MGAAETAGESVSSVPNSTPVTDIAQGPRLVRALPSRRTDRPSSQLDLKGPERLLFWLMAATLHVLSLVPDFVLYPIGVVGGYLGYLLDRRHARIGMKNLAVAFPDRSERDRRADPARAATRRR